MHYKKMKKLFLILLLLPSLVFASENFDQKKILEKAEAEYDQGNYDKTIAQLKKALKAHPEFEQARYLLAVSYHLSKNNKMALVELDKIKADPDVMQMVPILKGGIFSEDKRWKDALGLWLNFPQDNIDQKSMRSYGLAESYEGLGKSSDAANAWSEFLSLQMRPTNDILEHIAINRIKAGEKEKALNDCAAMELLQKHKDYQEICKAYVYIASGDKEQSMVAAQEALAINKENQDAKRLLETLKK